MKSATEILTSTSKFHITLGLDRIKKILEILKNPQNTYKVIHIAGTNGKGSTAKIINEILITNFKNKKIGLFTSPHIFSYTERIKINNIDIAQGVFDNMVNEINRLAIKNNIELSEFELISAVAFYYFYLEKVDYVVLEVGLGGMYDATNVVTPEISVITTIDFDHTERLGKTIEEIAAQKAGIIKEDRPVVISQNNPGYEEIKKTAEFKNARVYTPDKIDVRIISKTNFAIIRGKKFEFSLLGSHQKDNLALALKAAQLLKINDEEAIKKALKNVKWKFRLEYDKNLNLLVDCAHNPNGIESLKKFIDENFKNENKIFIFGCLKNKDYKKMIDILTKESVNSKFYFYEFDYPNALKFDELGKDYKKYFIKKIDKNEDVRKIIKTDGTLKIVAGSIYMLSKIFGQ